ncbi:MAG: ABC transporter substrate-binding protein [Anaerolineales bacterium]|jgi:ABC-type nitrate/sulfonate/bicarbonate transport system substrate-binding protein
MKYTWLRISLTIIALSLTACTAIFNTQPTPQTDFSMTFMAGYKPQANLPFVGVYVAQENGFYDEEGLDVLVKHSPGRGEHLQLLTTNKVQVTTQDAGVLLKRRADPGLPLVSIALIGQRGQQAFAALQTSGFSTPIDWEGHLVGYKGTPPPDFYALLAASGANPGKIELVNVGFDPRVLTEGQVDVYPVYKSNEPYLIRDWGYEITLWDAADYGVPTLGLAYVTSEEILAENPEMLTRFLRASLKGIEYASQHMDEAVEIVLTYTGPETDSAHMRYMLETELIDAQSRITNEHGIGWQTREQWNALSELLVEYDAMSATNVEAAFSNTLLSALNDDP